MEQKRQFTEKEVARILRDAAEMQGSTGSLHEEGVSAAELEKIAAEVGLSRSHVQAAMARLDEMDDGQTRWLGAPPSYEIEAIREGVLTHDQWQAMVAELNATFHQAETGAITGPVRTWYWKHELGSVQFTATQNENATRFKLVAFIDDGISAGFWGAIGAIVMGSGAVAANLDSWPLLQAASILLVVGGVSVWFRKLVSNWYRRDRRKLTKLMERLKTAAASVTSEGVEISERLEVDSPDELSSPADVRASY